MTTLETARLSEDSTVGDPVLQLLAQVEAQYQHSRATWERQIVELQTTVERQDADIQQATNALVQAQETATHLATRLAESQSQVETQREQTRRHRERADMLADLLKDIHRSIFSADVYTMILRACLTLTGGTRGMYITMRGTERKVRIRAAIDVDGYPQAEPSDFIQALCAKVIEDRQTLVCNQTTTLDGLPAPRDTSEHFHNCIVAPVTLLKHFDGVMIVADRTTGEFKDDDVETLVSIGDQAGIAVQNMQLQRELQQAYLSTVSMLADAVEAKDAYTQGHCEMVSRYAQLTAERLGLSDHDRSVVCYAALLHDVGKIGVTDGVLNKPGILTPEERELVRSHVRIGYSLVSHVAPLSEVAHVVLHHHEWWDGSGYPDGIAGEAIPLASRIICVVDAFCAMITRRSYKEAFTSERARNELQQFAGRQFDAAVVDAFLAILDLPEAHDQDDDTDAECGLLPALKHLYDVQTS